MNTEKIFFMCLKYEMVGIFNLSTLISTRNVWSMDTTDMTHYHKSYLSYFVKYIFGIPISY